MITLLDPRLWLAFILSIGLAFGAGNFHAHRVDAKAYALKEAKANAAVAEAKTEATTIVATGERTMAKRLDVNEQNHQKENDDAKVENDRLHADIRNGALRLSVLTRAARQNADTGSSTVAADSQETRSELLPAFADALVSIATDADGSVRSLNTCVDDYNAVRETVKQISVDMQKIE
jgi:hypothetical protein